MQLSNKMTKTTVITIILLMASIMLTVAQAQTQYTNMQQSGGAPLPAGVSADETFETIAHMSFRPNPVGIGQSVLVNLWLQPPLHVTRYIKDAYTVTFTKPDGTKDVIGPLSSYQGDSTAWFEHAVDSVGKWTIKFDFLGAYFPAGNYSTPIGWGGAQTTSFAKSCYYKPSSDGPYEFIVQEQLVASWPPAALPTDYWTRPISPENREWWTIAGNYPPTGIVGGGPNWPADTNTYMSNYKYVPYVQGPNTAHVLWKRQEALYGLIGGTMGQQSLVPMYFGSFGPSGPSIIYDGRCYQTETKAVNGVQISVLQCYDLRTGQIYWEQAGVPAPTMIFYENGLPTIPGADPNAWGTAIYLVAISGGRMIKYDPMTGAVALNVTIAPMTTGTLYMDKYFLSVQNLGTGKGYRLINWTVEGDMGPSSVWINIGMRVKNNITWPFSSLGTVDYETGIAVSTMSITPPSTGVASDVYIMAASLTTGQLLWNVSSSVGYGIFSGSTAVADHGKFAVRFNDGYWYCWDLASGKRLWKSELSNWPWGTFGCYGTASYGGMILANQYDGVVAYDWNSGKIDWNYQAVAPYPYETAYENDYPWFTPYSIIADGKLYTFNTEHTANQPITRGWRLHCINVTTGEGVWNITGSTAPVAVADGYLVGGDTYNGYMYVFGKGESATTVTAPDMAIQKGNGIMIKGTVLDMSPAQSGTPCVSKESMTIQMEYLHMQHPIDGIDHNLKMTGVPVTLTAIAADGSYINIGTVTTDAYHGTFACPWTPPNEGAYNIIASFAGDDSYGSSSAATAISVGPAEAAITFPEQITPADYTMTIIGGVIAVIIAVVVAVAIVGIVLYRKK